MACVVFVALEIISAGLSHTLRAAPAVSSQTGQRPATSTTQSSDDGVEVLPERVLQHVTRGDQLAGQGHFEEAVEEYRAAIKEAGHPVFTAYLNMGYVFFTKQAFPLAIEAYRQAVAVRPNSWQAHFNLAEALYAGEKYSDAEREYRRVLELRLSGVAIRAHHFLGLTLYKQGRIEDAIVEYHKAVELAAGNYAEARYNLGIALLEQKEAHEAEQQFKLAIEQEKRAWPEAQYNLAKAIEEQKRFQEAADAYEVYLKLSPNAADAKRMREYID